MLLRRLSTTPTRAKNTLNVDQLAELIDDVGARSVSGIAVNSHNALRQATVYSCVKIISECIASMPLKLHRRVSETEVEEVSDHPALDVLRKPNSFMTQHELLQYWITHFELRGNAYAYKVFLGNGRVGELLPLQPDMVGVMQWYDWRVIYTVGSGKDGVNGRFESDRIFHLKNFGTLPYKGESTIALHRDEIGLGLDMQRHAGSVFRNGTSIGTVFKHPKVLTQTAYDRLKKSIDDQFGGALNAGRPFIAEEGMDVAKLGMTMEDAEFIESRTFTKQEIASIFGVPMFLLNDTEKATTWGTGLEQISRAFLNFSLTPRMKRTCSKFQSELLTPKEQKDHFFAFDTDNFTLGDFVNRYNAYAKGIAYGVISSNDARHRERMNAREGGDKYFDPPMQTGWIDEDTGETSDNTKPAPAPEGAPALPAPTPAPKA
jgi:HK97 family phage portal protein